MEQATVKILPRPITLTASSQERIYGEALVLDETAFTVTDLDGDSTLPNGEVIDTVTLNSATGADLTTTANVGTYADEIAITGQSGSNGFSASNYDLTYVAGDLVVVAQPRIYAGQGPALYTLNATGSSGEVFNGVDGWSQSEANYSENYPRAYIQPFSGGVTGFAVGGFYDTEPFTGGNALTISQTLVGNLARGATLNATFQMQDSSVLNDPNDACLLYTSPSPRD